MQPTNSIGMLAETIVAVRICLDGTMVPIIRRRESNGRMTDCPGKAFPRAAHAQGSSFVARVAPGDSGVVAVIPNRWSPYTGYSGVVVPAGAHRPFADFDDPAANANGNQTTEGPAATHADEVWFHYTGEKIEWVNGTTSGSMRIDESFPDITVALRLPPGNHGEISFASPLFTTADGEPASVLSVA